MGLEHPDFVRDFAGERLKRLHAEADTAYRLSQIRQNSAAVHHHLFGLVGWISNLIPVKRVTRKHI